MMEVQYLTNSKGEKTAVQLSIKDWNELLSNPDIVGMLQELREALRQMNAYEAGDKSAGMTEQEFFASLNEPKGSAFILPCFRNVSKHY